MGCCICSFATCPFLTQCVLCDLSSHVVSYMEVVGSLSAFSPGAYPSTHLDEHLIRCVRAPCGHVFMRIKRINADTLPCVCPALPPPQHTHRTPGFTGADLQNLMNEAAILAARRDLKEISKEEIADALERIIAGGNRRIDQ